MMFWNVFKNSLLLPKKTAIFKLNRVGLDIAVFYNFILYFIISIPTLMNELRDSEMNVLFKLIYFFIFYYLPFTIIVFISLSIIAFLISILTKIFKRKLAYSLIWKISSFTTTIPLLLYLFVSIFYQIPSSLFVLAILYSIIILIRMIFIYPKRKTKQ